MESQKGTRNRVEKLRRSVSKYGKSYKPKFTSALGPQVVIHFVSFFVPIIGLIYLSYFNRPLMKLSTRGNDRGCFGVCPIGPGAWVLVAPGRAGSRATGRPIIVRVSPLAHLDTYLHRCQPPLAPSSPPSLRRRIIAKVYVQRRSLDDSGALDCPHNSREEEER